MPDNKKTSKPGEKNSRSKESRGKTTEELRRRHLSDKNDKITDDDIRNIRIDTSVDAGEGLDLPKGKNRPHDVDKDNKTSTPWDVISE
jgi:hypothetical protein